MNAGLQDMQLTPDQQPGGLTREAVSLSFGKAAAKYDTFAILQREVADALLLGIPDLKLVSTVLDLGCGTGYCSHLLNTRYPQAEVLALDLAEPMLRVAGSVFRHDAALICADAHELPLAGDSLDLLVSNLTLQWCGNFGQVFKELFRVLKPGGMALLSTFGTESLRELKQAFSMADTAVHVNEFVALADLNLTARCAGFTSHTASELRVRHYPTLMSLARELKGIGAHNMNDGRPAGLMGRARFECAASAFLKHFETGKGVPVTYEIHYLQLHKPEHD